MKDRTILKPGDHDTRAYVGPPSQYDFMGATQFRLLTTLGLREGHSVLDVGCGSMRAGRLLLPYLLPGNYFGVEPNKWLIDKMIEEEIGGEYISLRQPTFQHNSDFDFSGFNRKFDYIVMQSILSHTGSDLTVLAIENALSVMETSSLLLVTILHRDNVPAKISYGENTQGWLYPMCLSYDTSHFINIVSEQGGHCQELPWMHPRQTWWLITLDESRLMSSNQLEHMSGVVFNDTRFPD